MRLVRADGLEVTNLPEDTKNALYTLPLHMHEAVVRWLTQAEPAPMLMGTFFRSVLTNNFVEAVAAADDSNRAALVAWGRFLYNHMPACAWGSAEKLQEWYDVHHRRGDTTEKAEKEQ